MEFLEPTKKEVSGLISDLCNGVRHERQPYTPKIDKRQACCGNCRFFKHDGKTQTEGWGYYCSISQTSKFADSEACRIFRNKK